MLIEHLFISQYDREKNKGGFSKIMNERTTILHEYYLFILIIPVTISD
jgi:hypothetical protein